MFNRRTLLAGVAGLAAAAFAPLGLGRVLG
jgi:hypothetical protein